MCAIHAYRNYCKTNIGIGGCADGADADADAGTGVDVSLYIVVVRALYLNLIPISNISKIIYTCIYIYGRYNE
jgi:hypothetical protein